MIRTIILTPSAAADPTDFIVDNRSAIEAGGTG